MIAYFLRSAKDQICLAKLDGHENDVASFIYSGSGHSANLIMANKEETPICTEIASEIHEVLAKNQHILIVHMGLDGKPLKQYTVPLVNC